MPRTRRFPENILAALNKSKILAIRAGSRSHRFIGIWHVVVDNHLFVRSWTLKPKGWYRTFLEEPRGALPVGTEQSRSVPFRPRASV